MDREALLDAYLRRTRWEQRTQAVAIANVLGEAMSGRSGRNDGSATYTNGYKEISTDDMFSRIGVS